jgi:OOP family OmpA-OmpF porin
MKANVNPRIINSALNRNHRTMLQQAALTTTLVAALFAGSRSVEAATPDNGWYGNLNVGRSSIDAETDDVFANQGVASFSSVDKHDTTYSLGAGYQFNQNFALEGGYTDFGKFNVGSTIASPAADTAHGTYKIDGWNLSGVGIIPLNNGFSVYGKAGVIFADVKLNAGSDTGTVPVSRGSKSSTNGTYGLGTSYDFGNNLIGKLEWNRYQNLGESSSSGKVDLNTYTAGVSLRF